MSPIIRWSAGSHRFTFLRMGGKIAAVFCETSYSVCTGPVGTMVEKLETGGAAFGEQAVEEGRVEWEPPTFLLFFSYKPHGCTSISIHIPLVVDGVRK